MDPEAFTIAILCLVDELLGELAADPDCCRSRQRGQAPTLDDTEVLTMEAVGEFLGYDQDAAIDQHFRHEHPDVFPDLLRVHRTTFVREVTNLWMVKE